MENYEAFIQVGGRIIIFSSSLFYIVKRSPEHCSDQSFIFKMVSPVVPISHSCVVPKAGRKALLAWVGSRCNKSWIDSFGSCRAYDLRKGGISDITCNTINGDRRYVAIETCACNCQVLATIGIAFACADGVDRGHYLDNITLVTCIVARCKFCSVVVGEASTSEMSIELRWSISWLLRINYTSDCCNRVFVHGIVDVIPGWKVEAAAIDTNVNHQLIFMFVWRCILRVDSQTNWLAWVDNGGHHVEHDRCPIPTILNVAIGVSCASHQWAIWRLRDPHDHIELIVLFKPCHGQSIEKGRDRWCSPDQSVALRGRQDLVILYNLMSAIIN